MYFHDNANMLILYTIYIPGVGEAGKKWKDLAVLNLILV